MAIAKFRKKPVEVKRFDIEYSDWLDTGELVSDVTYEVSPSLEMEVVNQSILTGSRISFFVGGGNHNETYDVIVTMTTSNGQVRQDTVQFSIRA